MREPMVFTGGMAATNGYLIQAPGGPVLIDAPSGVADWLRAEAIKPVLLLLTHQHYDHVEDAAATRAWADCPIWAYADYSPELTLENLVRAAGWGVDVPPFTVDRVLAGESDIDVAGLPCTLRHIPGHAADSLAFVFPSGDVVYSGDTLFEGGVGRTDLPGGSWDTLLSGIRHHLLTLPAETLVFPGHGEATTIGTEAKSNPYLR